MCKLCIVVPVYNRIKGFENCIKSLKNISFEEDYEIILVDDYSEEEYSNFYKEYAKDNIKYIKLERHSGAGICRIEGLKVSNATYCTFVDSDDYVDPDFFKELFEKMDDDCDVIFGSVLLHRSNDKKEVYHLPEKILQKKEYIDISLTPTSMAIWGKLIKKKLLDNVIVPLGDCRMEELFYHFPIADKMSYAKIIQTKSFYHYNFRPKNNIFTFNKDFIEKTEELFNNYKLTRYQYRNLKDKLLQMKKNQRR